MVDAPFLVDKDAGRLVDQADLFDGLASLASLLNAGDGGLTGLSQTLVLAATATKADGAAFVEYGHHSGRIVAVTGDLSWTLGAPVDLEHPSIRQLLALGGGVRQYPSSLLGTAGGPALLGHGLRRLMMAEATAGATPVGVLAVAYQDEAGTATRDERAALMFLTTFVATQYTLGRGLPVYEDGPAVTPGGDALAVVSADGVVRSWNPAAALLTGRSTDSSVGRPWPYPLPEGGEVVQDTLHNGTEIEIRRAPVAGSTSSAVSFRARPDPAADGRDLFLALTGHELRTPVTVIRGYADTLNDHWDSLDEPSRKEAAHIIGQRAKELGRLLDRLLNAVSDDGQPADSTVHPFDAAVVLRAAVDELTPDLRRAVRVDLPKLPPVVGERASLPTVLTELLTNASKYSTDWVEISLTAGADETTVWFRVADRGVGIRPEHVERAFERFWQLETGDQRTIGGVGLGLYLVRRIVERQHGWVSLRPRQDGGTVAEVRLPRADTSHQEAGDRDDNRH
jgi:two-component system phosphate regulon sensor histidine kinase PhoR